MLLPYCNGIFIHDGNDDNVSNITAIIIVMS